MNTRLLQDIGVRIAGGLPTLAFGGGMLLLLEKLQDTLGRTSELAGVIPARGEVLWDLEDPAYVEVSSLRDNVLLAKGDKVMGWVLSEVELSGDGQMWDPPLALRGVGTHKERREAFGHESILCSPAMIHLAAKRDAAARFLERCKAYKVAEVQPPQGNLAAGQ